MVRRLVPAQRGIDFRKVSVPVVLAEQVPAAERYGVSCASMSVANEVLGEHDQSGSRPGGG